MSDVQLYLGDCLSRPDADTETAAKVIKKRNPPEISLVINCVPLDAESEYPYRMAWKTFFHLLSYLAQEDRDQPCQS